MRKTLVLCLGLLPAPAFAEVPTVMTDIPAVHSITAQVMGDLGTPAILLDKGSSPHHFQLRPSQARALSQADLVFWVGPRLTPWLDRAITGVGIEGTAIELIEAPGTDVRAFGEAHDHEEAHEDAHEQEEAHAQEDAHDADGDDHNHKTGIDPHAWLSPDNARVWTGVIAEELAKADPENAATYRANAAATLARIDAAVTEVHQILAPVGDAPIMVFHDAYGYYAEAFGVNVAGSIALGDAAAPGAAKLASIHHELAEEGAVCIFPEAQHDPAYVATVVEGTGVRVGAALDPSGSALDYGPGLYDALLTGLARDIAGCVTAE